VFLQRHAEQRLQKVSAQLIDAHQVKKKILRQQLWLAGRCKTLTPPISYGDTHCACISMTDKEHSALMRRIYKFCVRAAANSCKSGEFILHQEHPHIKKKMGGKWINKTVSFPQVEREGKQRN
jgi:hypothetical protein